MNYSIKSRKLGTTYTFYMPSDGGYVYLESKGACGTLGQQLTRGGGSTIRATPDTFQAVCKNWYRRHLKYMSDFGEEL